MNIYPLLDLLGRVPAAAILLPVFMYFNHKKTDKSAKIADGILITQIILLIVQVIATILFFLKPF